MPRLLVLAVFVAVAATGSARVHAAASCSCFPRDPRRAFLRADAAFVGRLAAKEVVRQSGSAVYTFRVERALKGKLPRRVRVHAPADGAACGLEVPVGGRIGLFLERARGRWTSHLCNQISAAALLRAARPLPRPDGQGAVALLAGGILGEARLVALDAQGRTLAYGIGDGYTSRIAVCPGAARVLELVFPERSGPRQIVARTLPALRRVGQVAALPDRLLANPYAGSLECLDAAGERARLFLAPEEGSARPSGLIVEARAGRLSMLYDGPAGSATLAGRTAYLAEGRRVVALDLETGARSVLARVPARTGAPVPSPDGRYLAAVVLTDADLPEQGPSLALVVDVRTGAVETASLGELHGGLEVAWIDSERFALLPSFDPEMRLRVLDTALHEVGAIERWAVYDSVVADGVAWGIGGGRLLRAELPGGPARVVRTFPGPELFTLSAVGSVAGGVDALAVEALRCRR